MASTSTDSILSQAECYTSAGGMTDLLRVVMQKLRGSLDTTVPGGFWHGRPGVPGTSLVMPYAVVDMSVGAGRQYESDGSSLSRQTVLFNVFGLSDIAVDIAMRDIDNVLVRSLYGAATDWGTGAVLSAAIVSQSLVELPERNENGLTVWQGTLNVEFLIDRR